MVDACKDTLETRNTNSLIGTDNFAYSPTIQIYQLTKLSEEFQKNATKINNSSGIINSSVINSSVINDFIDLYTKETFNQGLISFNNFLLSANTNTNFKLSVNYPNVYDRLIKGVAITPIEFSAFMEDVGYNPITIQNAVTNDPRTVLQLYNIHIGGKFSQSTMGAFCALAPSIFGAVAGFFTAIREFASKITDIINKIQNFSLSGLIDNLKSKVLSVIDNTIEKIKNIVKNFSIDGLISDVNKFFHDKVAAKFFILKDKAMKFFEKDNIDNFKKIVEGLISYATNIFKDPKLEEIQFLIYRFCSFITQVENIINGIKTPLEEFSNKYVYAGNILGTNSSVNTIDAVNAGANRFNESEVSAAIARGVSLETARGNQPPPSTEEYKDLPPWNDGAGDNRVTFQGNWVNPPGQGCSGGMGSEGWLWDSPVFLESKVYLMRVYKEFSRRTGINKIIVNSAYRSPKYNECLRGRGAGAAKNSNHMQGIAFDITWSGYPNNRDVFIEVARSLGFKGIGIYSGFTHIDRGKERQWNG